MYIYINSIHRVYVNKRGVHVVCIYIHIYVHTHIYLLKVRERRREQVPFYHLLVTHVDAFEADDTHIHMYVYTYIYQYVNCTYLL